MASSSVAAVAHAWAPTRPGSSYVACPSSCVLSDACNAWSMKWWWSRAPGQALPPLPAGVRRVDDDVPDQGPLGGLAPGLRTVTAPLAFVTTCDAPLLQRPFVEGMVRAAEGFDAAVGRAEGYTQPLAAVYARAIADTVAAFLAEGGRRPAHLLDRVQTHALDEAELRGFDPDLLSLRGCNTPEAFEALRREIDRLDPPARVTVELYEMARRIAGTSSVEVRGHTVREALRALETEVPTLAPSVVQDGLPTSTWRVAVDGRRFLEDLEAPLFDGEHLVLVSALAGG